MIMQPNIVGKKVKKDLKWSRLEKEAVKNVTK